MVYLEPGPRGEPLDPELVSVEASREKLELQSQAEDHRKLQALVDDHTWDDPGSGEARNAVFRPMSVIKAMEVQEGDVVADIGAGQGYFAFRLAREVGPTGTVWATEINPGLVHWLRGRLGTDEVDPLGNVRVHLNTLDDLGLEPGSLDLALVCDLTFPRFATLSPTNRSMVASIHRALRPGGRLVVIEKSGWRQFETLEAAPWGTIPPPADKDGHAPSDTPLANVVVDPRPFLDAGFCYVERNETLVVDHDFVIFGKPDGGQCP